MSLLAYGGLRPVEDRGSCWADVRGRTLHVVASKTGRAATSTCSRRWRRILRNGGFSAAGLAGKALIFPTLDGDEWKRYDWQNWRRRVYRPAAIAAGVTGDLRPYRLRGSFVSLLLWEGRSLT